MFAYCNNNPINSVDPTGQFTDGQIHDAVLEEINQKNGGRFTYRRSDNLIIYDHPYGGKWFGFCDLLDPGTGETWELKKNTASPTCRTEAAEKQLDNYINNGYLVSNPGLPLKYPETYILSGHFEKIDSLGNRYCITYWDQGGGILRYQYYIVPSQKTIVAMLVIAGTLLSVTTEDLQADSRVTVIKRPER